MPEKPSFPIVKSPHTKIFFLDFSWHTGLSIGNNWGPSGALKGTLRAWKRLNHASNYQIFFCSPFLWERPSTPIVKWTHSKIFYLNFSWHTWGTQKGTWGPLRAWKRPKHASNHQIFLCPPFIWATPSFPKMKLLLCKIYYLKFLRHIMLSIGDSFMGKLVIAHTKGGQRNIWLFEVYFGCFHALPAQMGPQGSVKDLNWMI